MQLIKGLAMLAASVVTIAAGPSEVAAKQLGAYVLFEVAEPGAKEKLRSASLGNCLQLVVGSAVSDELVLHLLCDERDGEGNATYLSQAVVELARIQGVRRATVVAVRSVGQ